MKMVFFSSDGAEIETVSQEFTQAGIACEIRKGLAPSRRQQKQPQAEVWIRNDKDCHRALMLCVQLGIGFSKRPDKSSLLDDLETAAAYEPHWSASDRPVPARSRKSGPRRF